MTSILLRLADSARQRVKEAKESVPLTVVAHRASRMVSDTGFPFEKALKGDDVQFICECKRASPSKGLITDDFPYIDIARSYEEAGAAAISVLTEPTLFMGSNMMLSDIATQVKVPCLRKDFVVDEYMVYEAKTLGASAVLLIAALLGEEDLRRYIRLCDKLGLSALVEAHTAPEIDRALNAGARVIGVNNRDLNSFDVDIKTSVMLRNLVPEGVTFVAESGIRTPEDVQKMREIKADAVLVGETMMRADDKKAMLAHLRGH